MPRVTSGKAIPSLRFDTTVGMSIRLIHTIIFITNSTVHSNIGAVSFFFSLSPYI